MQIQIHLSANLDGGESFASHVRNAVETALAHFSMRITRVDVHISDQNGEKNGGADKRCVIEARLAGRQPTAVANAAATLERAVDGAVDKLARSLERALGRVEDDR